MKVYVEDDDSGHSPHDKIDEIFYTIEGNPAKTSGVAPVNHRSIVGIRKIKYGKTETRQVKLKHSLSSEIPSISKNGIGNQSVLDLVRFL